MSTGFSPPPYPYDRLGELVKVAATCHGEVIDLSIGVPRDEPPKFMLEALADGDQARLYPPSAGTSLFRQAAAKWLSALTGVELDQRNVAATIGSKEFVVALAHLLKLRSPERSSVLYPAVSYPSYHMGAILGGCAPVPVPVGSDFNLDLDQIPQAAIDDALCIWVNTPGNPAGNLENLAKIAEWGRQHGVPVVSDECYIEFTWNGQPDTILSHGTDNVLSVHSLSKRSNFAGLRSGFYAGDPQLVHYLSEVRKHSGMMQPGPVMSAAVLAFQDTGHVERQREIYRARLETMIEALGAIGIEAQFPAGGFYLWVKAPSGNGWGLAHQLAETLGAVCSPGEFFGPSASEYVRLAAVQHQDMLDLMLVRAESS